MEDWKDKTTSFIVDNATIFALASAEDEDRGSISSDADAVIVPIVFGLVFIVGLVGNGLLIYTVLANSVMKTIPNIFLVNQAIGDVCLLLVSVPFRSVIYTCYEWVFGEAMCKLSEFMITLSLGVSVFTLTSLVVDRFVIVVFPTITRRWLTIRKTMVIAAVIWIVSLILAIPDLVTSRVISIYVDDSHSIRYCEIYGSSTVDFRSYWYFYFRPAFQFAIFFAIPFVVIATMYIAIARILLRYASLPAADSVQLEKASLWNKQLEIRKKLAKLIFIIVVLFMICWTPRYAYVFWFRYGNSEYNSFYHILKIFGFCMSFVYSCVNPLALYSVSDEFRQYFNHYLFGCCRPSCRLRTEEYVDGVEPLDDHMEGSSESACRYTVTEMT